MCKIRHGLGELQDGGIAVSFWESLGASSMDGDHQFMLLSATFPRKRLWLG